MSEPMIHSSGGDGAPGGGRPTVHKSRTHLLSSSVDKPKNAAWASLKEVSCPAWETACTYLRDHV